MFVFLCIDFMMVLLYLIIGIIFIRSNGRAIRYLTGHNLDEKYHNKLKVLIHIILLCVYFYCKFKNTDLLM